MQKRNVLRSVEWLKRDNAYKRVITAFDDAAHWWRIAEQDGIAPTKAQREKLTAVLDTIKRLANELAL